MLPVVCAGVGSVVCLGVLLVLVCMYVLAGCTFHSLQHMQSAPMTRTPPAPAGLGFIPITGIPAWMRALCRNTRTKLDSNLDANTFQEHQLGLQLKAKTNAKHAPAKNAPAAAAYETWSSVWSLDWSSFALPSPVGPYAIRLPSLSEYT